MSLIVKSKVKEYLEQAAGEKVSMAGDLPDALEEKVKQLLEEAVRRAKANNRKTVMAKDL